MSNLTIVAEPRTVVGKKVKGLRQNGLVPAVMYGATDSKTIQVNDRAVRAIFRNEGTSSLYNLQLEGKEYAVMLKDMQRHVTRGDLLHLDFLAVNMDEKVIQSVSLVEIGVAPVLVANKGFVDNVLRMVETECLPNALISEVQVDISLIAEPGDVIRLKDLVVPDGVELIGDPETLVAKFTPMREHKEDVEDEDEEAVVEDDAAE